MDSNVYELMGIIKGINYDNVINELEIAKLEQWVVENRHNKLDFNINKIIKILDDVLKDGIIDDQEKIILLKLSSQYLVSNESIDHMLIALNGIIEGIISDNVVNADEIYMLSAWLKNHSVLSGNSGYDTINRLVASILADGKVTSDEQQKLYEELKNQSKYSMMDLKLKYICQMIDENSLIGNEIIDLFNNKEIIDFIHKCAEQKIKTCMDTYSSTGIYNSEIVFLSLCLIALTYYDGSFYTHVEKVYPYLFKRFSSQRIHSFIRAVINRFQKRKSLDRERVINGVLENAIVPLPFLASFFDFINDVYIINFNYEINDLNIDEEFNSIFEGLSKVITDKDDNMVLEVTKKSYKLIKTTKTLILDDKKRNALIQLSSNVLKIIDEFYHNPKKVSNYNDYYNIGFSKWRKRQRGNVRQFKQRISLSNQKKTIFYLNGENIILKLPKINIKKMSKLPDFKLEIINGKHLIKKSADVTIREIIGGFQIEFKDQIIEQPLDNLRCLIYSDDDILFDSKNYLYRSFILFDEKGYEVKPNSDFSGIVFICLKYTNDIHIQQIANTHHYLIGFATVNKNTVIEINGKKVSFKKEMKPDIYGDSIKDTYVQIGKKQYARVFNCIHILVFESIFSPDLLGIQLNGLKRNLLCYQYEFSIQNGVYKYIVDFSLTEPDIYDLVIYNIQTCESIKNGEFTFVIDHLSYSAQKINQNHYEYSLESKLNFIKTGEIDIEFFDNFDLRFIYKRKPCRYLIPWDIPIYKIDDKSWKSLEKYLWIDDLHNESLMKVFGFLWDQVGLYDVDGKLLANLKTKRLDRENYSVVNIGNLRNYINNYDRTIIKFFLNGAEKNEIKCYNKCIFDDDYSFFEYDPIEKVLNASINVYGSGNLYFTILDSKNNKLFQQKISESDYLTIYNLPTFEECTLSIEDKPKGFTFTKSRKILDRKMIFYSFTGLENQLYKIVLIELEKFEKNTVKYYTSRINNCFVKFLKQVDDRNFSGEIYSKFNGEFILLPNINPVKIEVLGDLLNDMVDISITKDGDGLLFNERKRRILPSMDDSNAPDIFSYQINLKGDDIDGKIKSNRAI